jgi:hypothetical protein
VIGKECGACGGTAAAGVHMAGGDRDGWRWFCVEHLEDAEAEINRLHMLRTLGLVSEPEARHDPSCSHCLHWRQAHQCCVCGDVKAVSA